jgi:hypothetical protein
MNSHDKIDDDYWNSLLDYVENLSLEDEFYSCEEDYLYYIDRIEDQK